MSLKVNYIIDIYNRSGVKVMTFPNPDLNSFTYSKFLRSGGGADIRINGTDVLVVDLPLPESLDFVIVINRMDEFWQTEYEVDGVYLLRGTQLSQLTAGNWLTFAYGVSLSDMLVAEATTPSNATKSGKIGDVALEYARDLLSMFPSISVESSESSDSYWSGTRTYKKLFTILEELADIDNAQFIIDTDYKFKWMYPVNNGVTIEPSLGQIKELRITDHYIDLVTKATMLGSGIGEERKSQTVIDNTFGNNKYGEFFYRHVVRGENSDDDGELISKAYGEIAERIQQIVDVQFDLTNHPSLRYKKDFDINHVLTLNIFGRSLTVLVTAVFVTKNKSGVDNITVRCKFHGEH